MSCPLTWAGCPRPIDTKMNRTTTLAAFFAAVVLAFAACDPQEIPAPTPDVPDTEQQDTVTTETPDTTDVNEVPEDPVIVDDNSAFEGLKHSEFAESEEKFANPERGFYFVESVHSATEKPLQPTLMSVQRKFNRTVMYMGCYLTDYMESDVAPEFLELLRTNLQVAREGGVKIVLRFAYTDDQNSANPEPTPEWVLRHIENITPVLQEFGDIIMCFQAGFVGVWGEWYYTKHFVSNPKTPEEHALRKQVTDAMLKALPADRQIALRTPMFARMMYAKDYTDTLTLATAHNGSDRSRLSGFNDCFGASSSDQGTFSGSETREFWKKDTRYVFMGGETCAVSNYCKCEQSIKDMEDYHWTYLNSEYNGKVLNVWKNGGCFEEVERRLGYRLWMKDAFITETPAAGSDIRVALRIVNTGFSAPINPRAVELILVDGNGNKTVYDLDDVDPRYWFAGERHILDKTIQLPADASGDCVLYLNLPDPEVTIHDNPLFSIRLANDGIWDETTGYNKIAEFTL